MPHTDLVFVALGVAFLVGSIAPGLLRERTLSAPIVVVAIGMVLGWLMPTETALVGVLEHPAVAERATEFTAIIALFGVGLALDRPLSFRGWTTTWRLLAIGMPLAIAATAFTGQWLLGLAPASALLLAAALAPTDPVLASDVQVEGPSTGESGEDVDDEHDEARFALTSEAGFNDALAFPFVYLAITLTGHDLSWGLVGHWLAWELVGKTVIGAVVGFAIGKAVGALLFRVAVGDGPLVAYAEPAAAVATVFLAYGLGELAHGWGFLAVFCAALALRAAEREHEHHERMHGFLEDLEHFLTLLVLLLIGASFTQDVFARLTWQHWVLAALVLLVVRPVTAWLSMLGDSRVDTAEGRVVAFFGVRGVGAVYYLSYALGHFGPDVGETVWPAVCLVVVGSIALHGVTATPVMSALDRRHARAAAWRRSGRRPAGARRRPRGSVATAPPGQDGDRTGA